MKSDENQVPVEQSKETSGDLGNEKKDVVAYDSYQKVLSEKKRAQESALKAQETIEKLQTEKLQAEGKKDELISHLQDKLSAVEKKLETSNKSYAWNTLTGAIKREAIKNGCTDADKLIRLMSDDDLKSISVGEDFSIGTDSLKSVIEKNKTENFFLFKDSTKKVVNGNPKNKIEDVEKTDLSKLSLEELKELHKKTYNN